MQKRTLQTLLLAALCAAPVHHAGASGMPVVDVVSIFQTIMQSQQDWTIWQQQYAKIQEQMQNTMRGEFGKLSDTKLQEWSPADYKKMLQKKQQQECSRYTNPDSQKACRQEYRLKMMRVDVYDKGYRAIRAELQKLQQQIQARNRINGERTAGQQAKYEQLIAATQRNITIKLQTGDYELKNLDNQLQIVQENRRELAKEQIRGNGAGAKQIVGKLTVSGVLSGQIKTYNEKTNNLKSRNQQTSSPYIP